MSEARVFADNFHRTFAQVFGEPDKKCVLDTKTDQRTASDTGR